MDREPIRIDEHGIRPPPAFAISGEPVDGAVAVRLEGELDMSASAQLRATVAATAGRAVVLDLTRVTFVDSSALRELLRARDEISARGDRLVLAGVPAAGLRLMELTRTVGLFELAPTTAAALARLRGA